MGSPPPGPPRGVTVPKNVLKQWQKRAIKAGDKILVKKIERYIKMANY